MIKDILLAVGLGLVAAGFFIIDKPIAGYVFALGSYVMITFIIIVNGRK